MADKDFDITKHDIVPRHEILKDKDRDEVLKKYGITLRQLPRILDTDPIVKVLEGKHGDMVRITRKSPTAGEAVYYRVVVKGAGK